MFIAMPNLPFTNIFGSSSASSSSSNSSSPSNINPSFDVEESESYLSGLLESLGEQNAKDRVYNSAQAEANRAFQSEEAEKQRNWYTEMSSTAYQRAMADMKKAGLNPILAYAQGGASSAGTAVPSGSAASHSSGGGDTLSSMINSVANLISVFITSSANKRSDVFQLLKLLG